MNNLRKSAFVILNWNCKDTIFQCIDSLKLNTSENNIIVVDNGSTDNSMELIEKEYPKITTIYNNKNLGFSGGVNKGIELAIEREYKYVALVNPDAYIEANWLKELEEVLDSKKDVGIVASKLINPINNTIDSAGDAVSDWLLPYIYGEGDSIDKYTKGRYMPSGCAGASLYRVSTLVDVGLFDDKYFIYYEDTDLALRAQLKGWRAYYEPNAVGYHVRNSSSRKVKPLVVEQSIRNRYILVLKTMPVRVLLRHGYKFFFVSPLFVLNQIRKGYAKAAIKGVLKSFAATPYALSSRRNIMKAKKVSSKEYANRVLLKGAPPIPFIQFLSRFMK